MEDEVKKNASECIQEIVLNSWKADCDKEEKRSMERWRCKEIWYLDYIRKYGHNVIKEKNADNQPRRNKHNKPQSPASDPPIFTGILCKNETNDTNFYPRNLTRPHQTRKPRQNKQVHRGTTNYNDHGRSQNGQRTKPDRYGNRNQIVRNQQHNMHRENGVTYIGRRVNQYFLGGGKPSRGQRFKTPQFQH
jgi:hypothetical protein